MVQAIVCWAPTYPKYLQQSVSFATAIDAARITETCSEAQASRQAGIVVAATH